MADNVSAKEGVKPQGLKGISDQQVGYHFDTHYKAYVTKINEIWEKLQTADRSKANQNFSDYRVLKVEESFNWMGVILHELYFENMKDGKGGPPAGEAKGAIDAAFGSFDRFKEDFKACGIAFRGWAILAFDLNDGKIRTYGADAHNLYGIWNAVPLLVLDTYEHAYYTDQGPKRPPYIDAFFDNVNWDVVNRRLAKARKAHEALK